MLIIKCSAVVALEVNLRSSLHTGDRAQHPTGTTLTSDWFIHPAGRALTSDWFIHLTGRTLPSDWFIHLTGRALTSDRYANSFIVIIQKTTFRKVHSEFSVKARLKIFLDQSELSALPAAFPTGFTSTTILLFGILD